jgi:hypothetical protein
MDEIGVARAVRRLDFDFTLSRCLCIGRFRQRHRDTGGDQHAELAAGDQPSRLVFLHAFCKMVLIAHVCSSSTG